MRILILLAAVLSFSLANEIYELDFEDVKFDLNHDLVDEFLAKYEAAKNLRKGAGITAIVNEFADRIFENIETYSVSHGLDPMGLTNISQNFLTASLTLTHGFLNGISTINRTKDDVEVSYRSDIKELEIHAPIVFSNLNFTYDYHVIVLLIGPKGAMTGKIKDFKMDIILTFNFNTYQAKVERVKTTNMGHVSLTFQGHGILDLVVNILSEFVTAVLHPLIGSVIQVTVSNVMQQVVSSVNGAINDTLHPVNETSATLYYG